MQTPPTGLAYDYFLSFLPTFFCPAVLRVKMLGGLI